MDSLSLASSGQWAPRNGSRDVIPKGDWEKWDDRGLVGQGREHPYNGRRRLLNPSTLTRH